MLIDCFTKIGVPKGLQDYISSKKELYIKQGLDENAASHKALNDVKNETAGHFVKLYSDIGNEKFSPKIETGNASTKPAIILPSEVKEIQDKEIVPPTKSPETNETPTEDISDNPEMTKVSNAVNNAFVEGKFGTEALDSVIGKLEDADFKKVYDNVKGKIEKGISSTKTIREKVLTQKGGTATDQAGLLYDLVDLKNKEKAITQEILATTDPKEIDNLQNQLSNVQNEMADNALANRMIGRDWYHIGMIRQQWAKDDFSLANMKEQFMASKRVKELTPEQDKEIKAAYDSIRELKVKVENARAEKDKAIEENDKLISENQKLKELGDKIKNQRKTDRGKKADEVIEKSNKRISDVKERLKQLRGGLNDATKVIPETAVLIGKIAAEKVYQGVVKFKELVENILDEVKDIFPEWKEEDVRNHLLYDEKSGTSSSAAARYYKSDEGVTLNNKELRQKVKDYYDLQKEYAVKLFEWQKERRQDVMAKRPFKERMLDYILRWQRFAVLSYPSTIVKLAAVVGQQLVLKPLKWAIQKAIYSLAEGVTHLPRLVGGEKGSNPLAKAAIFGNPSVRAIGKYYSALIRNFSLANLKEQFSGIDTKEIMYGDKTHYDEWVAAKGLLEMPGRSHGYIKSFIKNPEFQFAHEQQITFSLSKMVEIEEKIKDTNLSEKERTELKDEYDNNDITKDEVMEKINKLSLEHGKWGILMNDNKFVQKMQNFMDKKQIGTAFLRSELPILKIPVNYVNRAFAIKYGLIKAVTGSKWAGGDTPSIISLVYKGTKDLKPEQAELLGKTLNLGSMGAAFFVLGYMAKNQIEENDDGSAQIYGVHVSKNLIHSPELESFFAGATTAHEKDKGTDWIRSFIAGDIQVAEKSPFISMLKYGFISNVASAMLSKSDNNKTIDKIQNSISKKIVDMGIPGFVKQPAGWIDTKESGIHPMGEPIRRTPQGDWMERFWQTFEMAIPGLRSDVPVSSTKSSNRLNKISHPQKQRFQTIEH